MSRELADYLDAYRPDSFRGFGTVSLPGVGPMTPSPAPTTVPPATTSGAVTAIQAQLAARLAPLLAPSTAPADVARIDNLMWALDSQWLGAASWASLRSCVRIKYFGQGTIATPWAELGTDGCKNWNGDPVASTCDWGFWRINRCDLTTASTLVFQLERYLWAQARMRELLANIPRPGVTSAQDAADWTWKASELISALLWSTNVRFDNPNAASTAGNYATDLTRARLLFAPPSSADAGFAYDGPALSRSPYFIPYGLSPRVLNNIGDLRIAPTRQSDFNPGDGPLAFMVRGSTVAHPYFAQATAAGPAPYYSTTPLGISEAQIEEVRQMALSINTASGSSDGLRWASTKAFNDWWFRATWSWSTMWRPLGDFYTQTKHTPSGPGGGTTTYGWSTTPRTVVIGGARQAVERLASQLRFYSDKTAPTNNYVAWMQSAMTTYNVDTSGVPSTTPAGAAFNRSKTQLLQNITTASSQAATQAATAGSSGGAAATYTALAISLFQTVLSLVGQSVPLIGALYSVLSQATQMIVTAGAATGNTPCPAFPFLRVMSPSSGECTISSDDIAATLLSISSNARWPVAIAGQTRTFAVDGRSFVVTFGADATADLVARRINAAAALAGLGTVASVRNGQVIIEGHDYSAGPPRATAGTAVALGFPGPTTSPPVVAPAPSPAPGPAPTPTPAKSSSLPLLVGGALLLRFLLGS